MQHSDCFSHNAFLRLRISCFLHSISLTLVSKTRILVQTRSVKHVLDHQKYLARLSYSDQGEIWGSRNTLNSLQYICIQESILFVHTYFGQPEILDIPVPYFGPKSREQEYPKSQEYLFGYSCSQESILFVGNRNIQNLAGQASNDFFFCMFFRTEVLVIATSVTKRF